MTDFGIAGPTLSESPSSHLPCQNKETDMFADARGRNNRWLVNQTLSPTLKSHLWCQMKETDMLFCLLMQEGGLICGLSITLLSPTLKSHLWCQMKETNISC